MRRYSFLTHKSNRKAYFLKHYGGKGYAGPKETRMRPRPFSSALHLRTCLRNEKVPAMSHCPKVRSQRVTQSGFSHQAAPEPGNSRTVTAACQLHREASRPTGIGGAQGCRVGRADSMFPHRTTQGQTCLINHINCKEGALSQQTDPAHCNIKERPSIETSSLAPSLGCSAKYYHFFFFFGTNSQKHSVKTPLALAPHRALHRVR